MSLLQREKVVRIFALGAYLAAFAFGSFVHFHGDVGRSTRRGAGERPSALWTSHTCARVNTSCKISIRREVHPAPKDVSESKQPNTSTFETNGQWELASSSSSDACPSCRFLSIKSVSVGFCPSISHELIAFYASTQRAALVFSNHPKPFLPRAPPYRNS